MHVVLRAHAFAKAAHEGQVRKFGGEPYFNHPKRVARILVDHGITRPTALSAALLHDVVEDCGVTFMTLADTFGCTIASHVADLSDLEPGNRAERKAAARYRLGSSPGIVQSIKCADLIDNTADIVRFDPAFAKVYLGEKRLLLKVLTIADPSILSLAWRSLRHGEALLMAKRG